MTEVPLCCPSSSPGDGAGECAEAGCLAAICSVCHRGLCPCRYLHSAQCRWGTWGLFVQFPEWGFGCLGWLDLILGFQCDSLEVVLAWCFSLGSWRQLRWLPMSKPEKKVYKKIKFLLTVAVTVLSVVWPEGISVLRFVRSY